MAGGKYEPTAFEHARDELFSHIRRCEVIEADADQQQEWLADTMDYLADRYPELSRKELDDLNKIGLRYCNPVIPHGETDARDMDEFDDVEERVATT